MVYSRVQYQGQYSLTSSLMTWILVQRAFSKFTNDTEQGRVFLVPDGCATSQRDFDRLKKSVDRNLMKFIKVQKKSWE